MENNQTGNKYVGIEQQLMNLVDALKTTGYRIAGTLETVEAVQGTNFTTTSATYVDTGISQTVTTGTKPELLLVWLSGMANVSALAAAMVTLRADTTDYTDEVAWYPSAANEWSVYSKMYIINVAANASITLKGRTKTSAGTQTILRVGGYCQQSIKVVRLIAV
jgi:hypothetical protein